MRVYNLVALFVVTVAVSSFTFADESLKPGPSKPTRLYSSEINGEHLGDIRFDLGACRTTEPLAIDIQLKNCRDTSIAVVKAIASCSCASLEVTKKAAKVGDCVGLTVAVANSLGMPMVTVLWQRVNTFGHMGVTPALGVTESAWSMTLH